MLRAKLWETSQTSLSEAVKVRVNPRPGSKVPQNGRVHLFLSMFLGALLFLDKFTDAGHRFTNFQPLVYPFIDDYIVKLRMRCTCEVSLTIAL